MITAHLCNGSPRRMAPDPRSPRSSGQKQACHILAGGMPHAVKKKPYRTKSTYEKNSTRYTRYQVAACSMYPGYKNQNDIQLVAAALLYRRSSHGAHSVGVLGFVMFLFDARYHLLIVLVIGFVQRCVPDQCVKTVGI